VKSKPQILIKRNIIEIHTKKVSVFGNSFIAVLALSLLALPIMSLIMMIKMGDGLHFGLFIGFGGFWFFSYFMTRQFLWNVYGKEVLTFKNRRISYYSDFKYFQDSHKDFDAENFNVFVREYQEWDVKLGVIVFANDDEEIELATKVPLEEANAIVEKFILSLSRG